MMIPGTASPIKDGRRLFQKKLILLKKKERRMEEVGLKKGVLGIPSLFAVAVGLVVASTTLVSLGQGMGHGGYGFITAMLIAFVLMIFQAFTFAELAITMPKAGSVSSYTQIAIGHFPAIVSVITGYIIVQLLAAPAELAVGGIVVSTCFFPDVSPLWISIGMLFVLAGFNLLNVDVFARVQITLTIIKIGTIFFIGLAGLLMTGKPQVAVTHAASSFTDVFSLVSLAVWLFIGVEFMCPLIEEAKKPVRDIPIAMLGGLVAILILNIVFGMAAALWVPGEKLAASPIPHVDVGSAIFGKVGLYWVGLAGGAATAGTINTLLAAVPRMLYGMAAARQVPKIFGYLHPRFRTPWVGTIALAFGMFVQLISGISTTQIIVVFIVASAFSWLLTYAIAHVDAIILRYKYLNLRRPFKTPGFPVPQIVGIIGIIFVLMNIFPEPETKFLIYKYAGFFILGAAIYSFIWCKFVIKKGLFKPTPLAEALGEEIETEPHKYETMS
jgi:amino acid transporter